MNEVLVNKDNPQYQQDRISRLVSENHPTLTVEFEHKGSMRFRLLKAGRIVGSVKEPEELLVSKMADKSDAALILLIEEVLAQLPKP
jgi:hypothetical protein